MATATVVPPADRRPRVLDGLHLGLPNYWYPIMPSSELGQRPIQVRRFGEDLVVWRDSLGRPNVFESHCPHRGAPLSLGNIQGQELACVYHGWRFDGSGACTAMPLEEEGSSRPARRRLKAYAAEDRAGYIWMFYGDRERATRLAVPPELEDASWLVFRTNYLWRTNWINILDNVLDPLHAIYLHTGAYTQRRRARFKAFQVTSDVDSGFHLGKLGYREDGSVGPVEGEVELVLPNVVRLDLANGTRQGIMRVIIMPTPIDENTAWAFYTRSRQVTGWKRLQWRLAWWTIYRRTVNKIAGQDGEVMAGIGPIGEARLREHLATSDAGVIHLRRRLTRAFGEGPARHGDVDEQIGNVDQVAEGGVG
jgi:phenylpropionate dioxygenase-like ring-hydroxylating dioxygenase large terminal subunit